MIVKRVENLCDIKHLYLRKKDKEQQENKTEIIKQMKFCFLFFSFQRNDEQHFHFVCF